MEHNPTFSEFISTVQDVENYRALKDGALESMLQLALKFSRDPRKHERLIRALLWPVLWPLLLRGREQKDSKLIRQVLEVVVQFSRNPNNYEAILELKNQDKSYLELKQQDKAILDQKKQEVKQGILHILESLMNYENPEVCKQVLHIFKNFSGSDVALRQLRESGIIERCMRVKMKELGTKSELFLLEIICNACCFSKVRQDAMDTQFLKQVFQGFQSLDTEQILLTLKIVRRLAFDIENHAKLRTFDLNLRLLECMHWLEEREKSGPVNEEGGLIGDFKREISATLMNLLKNRDNHSQFVNKYFIEAITFLAKSSNEETDFYATCALSHMSELFKSHKTLVESMAIELMNEKLIEAKDLVIHRQGCRFFANLSFNSEYQKRMIKGDIVSYLVKAVDNHDRDTVKHSVIAIANLSSSEEFFNKLEKLPGIKCIIHLLDSSKERDKDLLINASIALCNLTAYQTNLHNLFIKEPEISTLKTAIEKSYEEFQHEDLTCILLKVVCNLTKNQLTLYYLSKKGFLSLLFNILRGSHNRKFYANVVGAIADITSRLDCQKQFLDEKIMPVILQNFTLSSENDQKIVAVALATLLLNGFSVQQQFIKNGGIEKLLYLIRKNDFLQKRLACKSFSLLSEDESNMKKLTEDECLTKIIRSCFTYKHIDLITTRELIKLFINFIIFGQEQPQHMLKMIVSVCETCLLLEDKHINVLALFTLNLLSERVENHYIFMQSGLLKLLDDLVTQIDLHDKDLFKQFTLSLLLNFARNHKMHESMLQENVFNMIHHLSYYAHEGLLCYASTVIRKLLHSHHTTKRVKMQAVVDKMHEQLAHTFFRSVFREKYYWLYPEVLIILKTTVRFHRKLSEYRSLIPFLANILTSLPPSQPLPQHALNALYILATLSYEPDLFKEFTDPQLQHFLLRELYMNRPSSQPNAPALPPEFLDFYVPLCVIFANLAQIPSFLHNLCISQCRLIPLPSSVTAAEEDVVHVKEGGDTASYLRVEPLKIINLIRHPNLLISQEASRVLASISFDSEFSGDLISNAVVKELLAVVGSEEGTAPLLGMSALVILHNCSRRKEQASALVSKLGLMEVCSRALFRVESGLEKYMALKIICNLSLNSEGRLVGEDVLEHCMSVVRASVQQDRKLEELSCGMCAVALKVLIKGVVVQNPALTEDHVDEMMDLVEKLLLKVDSEGEKDWEKEELKVVAAQLICLMAHEPRRAKKLLSLKHVSIFIITSMDETNVKILKLSIRTFVKLCLVEDGQILDKMGDFNQLEEVIERINDLPSEKEKEQFLEHYLEVLSKIFRSENIIEKINIPKTQQTILRIMKQTKSRRVRVNAVELLFTLLHFMKSVSKYEKEIVQALMELYHSEPQATQSKVVAIVVKASVNFQNHKRLIKYGFFQELSNAVSDDGRLEVFGLLNLALNPDNYDLIAPQLKKVFQKLFDAQLESKYYMGLVETTLRYLVDKKKSRENEKIVVMQKAVVAVVNSVSKRVRGSELYFCALMAQLLEEVPKIALTWIWRGGTSFMKFINEQFQRSQTDELLDECTDQKSLELMAALIKMLYLFTESNKFVHSCIKNHFEQIIQHIANFLLVVLGQLGYLTACSEGLVLVIDYITQKCEGGVRLSKRFQGDILRLIERTLQLDKCVSRQINANGLRCLSKIAHFDFVASSPIIHNKTTLDNCIKIFILNEEFEQKLDQNICLVLDSFSKHDQHLLSLASRKKSTFILDQLRKTLDDPQKQGFTVKLLSVLFRILKKAPPPLADLNLPKLLQLLTAVLNDPYSTSQSVHEVVLRTATCLLVMNQRPEVLALDWLPFLKSLQLLDIKFSELSLQYTSGLLLLLCQLWTPEQLAPNFSYYSRLLIYQLSHLKRHKEVQMIFGCLSELIKSPSSTLLISKSETLVAAIASYPLRVLHPTVQLRCCYLQSLRLLRELASYPETHAPLINSKFVELGSQNLLNFPDVTNPSYNAITSQESTLHILISNTYLANILEKINAGPMRDQAYLPKDLVTPSMLNLEKNLCRWSDHDDLLFYGIQFLHSLSFKHQFFLEQSVAQMVADSLARLLFTEIGERPSNVTATMAQILLKLLSRHELSNVSKYKLLHFLPEHLKDLCKEESSLVLELLIQSRAVPACHQASHIAKIIRFYASHIDDLTSASGLLLKSLRFLLQVLLKAPEMLQKEGPNLLRCVEKYSNYATDLARKEVRQTQEDEIIESFLAIYKNYFMQLYKLKGFYNPGLDAVSLCLNLMRQKFFSRQVSEILLQSLSHVELASKIFQQPNLELFFQNFSQHYSDQDYLLMIDRILECSKLPLKLYFLAQIRKIFLRQSNTPQNLIALLTRLFKSESIKPNSSSQDQLESDFTEISLALASQILKKLGFDKECILQQPLLKSLIEHSDHDSRIRLFLRALQLLSASLIAPKPPEGFPMSDFLSLTRLALDKLMQMPELFSGITSPTLWQEEPRFSFSYEEFLSKRSDFLALFQNRIVFIFQELFKANEKDLLQVLVAPSRDLLLKIGQNYLRTQDPSQAYVYLRSLKLLLATDTDLKERILLLNSIVLRQLQTDQKPIIVRLCIITFIELFKRNKLLSCVDFPALYRLTKPWTLRSQPQYIQISLRASKLCEMMSSAEDKIDEPELHQKLETILSKFDDSKESLVLLHSNFNNLFFREQLLKPERVKIIAPILMTHLSNPHTSPLILEIFLETSSEDNILLQTLVNSKSLPLFTQLSDDKSMLLLLKLLTNLSALSPFYQKALLTQEIFSFLTRLPPSSRKLIIDILSRLTSNPEFHDSLMKVGIIRVIWKILSSAPEPELKDLVQQTSQMYSQLLEEKKDHFISQMCIDSHELIHLGIKSNLSPLQLLATFILYLFLQKIPHSSNLKPELLHHLQLNLQANSEDKLILKQYSCVCLLQILTSQSSPFYQTLLPKRLEVAIEALSELKRPSLNKEIRRCLIYGLARQESLLLQDRASSLFLKKLIEIISRDSSPSRNDFTVMLLKALRPLTQITPTHELLAEAITHLQELKVFQSYKNQIKNQLQTQAPDANLNTRFQKASAPLKLLFSLQSSAPLLLGNQGHVFDQIIGAILQFESIPLEFYEKIGFYYKAALPGGYALDPEQVISYLTHNTLVQEGVLTKALSHIQPKFHHLMDLLALVGRLFVKREDLPHPAHLVSRLWQQYLLYLDKLRTHYDKNQEPTDVQIDTAGNILENLRDFLRMNIEIPLQQVVSGVVAALAIFESDQLIVVACYDCLREITKQEKEGDAFGEARLVELASIVFRHIASYDCSVALKFIMELVEYLMKMKTKVPAPFVLMLERLNERLKIPDLAKAHLLLKTSE